MMTSRDDDLVANALAAGVVLPGPTEALATADLVLDAVLGTGRSRPLAGLMKDVLDAVNTEKRRRPALRTVALDIPTGIDADTGALDPSAFQADLTVTLGYPKRGLFQSPGGEAAGEVRIVDIGIPAGIGEDLPLELITPGLVRTELPPRPRDANKGTFGRVLVVAGSGNFIGAAVLACRGALRSGAGLVTLAAPAPLVRAVSGTLLEPIYIPLPATEAGHIATAAVKELGPRLGEFSAIAVGCGMGLDPETAGFLEELLLSDFTIPAPLVLDADALNILAMVPGWWQRLRGRAVLTPHPGEMGRLSGRPVAEVQRDRVGAAQEGADQWQQTVVLKGSYTVIAGGGCTRISPFAVPALATGGTGDVLTGVIAGLLAQGATPLAAASSGVYVHGEAGRRFTDARGDSGLAASDLPGLIPDVLRDMRL